MDRIISLNEIRSRCSEFAVAWRDAVGDEKQEDQSFVRDLLQAFGISDIKAALFQKRVQRSSTGNQGYIDALIPGVLLIEMKSAGKSLVLAEAQALDYIQHLPESEVPRYVLTCDFKKFRLLDMQAPSGSDTIEFGLEQLPNKVEDLSFLAGYRSTHFGSADQEEASIKAAKLMADLYEALEGSGYSEHESSIFLVRTLFLLFADDAGVWQRGLFSDFLANRTQSDGSDLGSQMASLFQVLNQPQEKRPATLDATIAKFPYVNGGIFAEALSIASFNKRMHDQLIKACAFDWSLISPAIFGSLFQAVKSAEARRELGEHYTTETNILKTIRPLFLDDLEQEFENAKSDLNALKLLREKLSLIRILDPACGCGNFLVVSYRELRALELRILKNLLELGDKSALPTLFFDRKDLAVQIDHIFGIEIEEWPARIAQTALLLAEHQANQAMSSALGKAPSVLPLERFEGIHMANALRADWSQITPPQQFTYIVGNPPFIGHISKTLGQVEDLREVWGAEFDGYMDYVTGWFKKAMSYFAIPNPGRFAFVATNSITQGQPVEPLFRAIFSNGWRVRFAHQTFAWSSEAPGAASVHCVIIGFDKEISPKPSLFVYPSLRSSPVRTEVEQINGYLVAAPNIFVQKRTSMLSSQIPQASFGTMPIDGGNLIVEKEDYALVASDPTANKYLRRFVMGKELINNLPRHCLWLQDLLPEDLEKSKILKSRVEACRSYREAAPKSGDAYKYRTTPHLFRPNANRPKSHYLAIPAVFSENRLWATCEYLAPDVIAGNKVYVCSDPDGFAFSLVSSSMFITWQKAVGGRLKSDPSFSNTLVWNNIPLPHVPDNLRQEIIHAGKALLEVRSKHPDRSLANLYNPLAMPAELVKAHVALDKLVDRAFGSPRPLNSASEREDILFANYLRMTSSVV